MGFIDGKFRKVRLDQSPWLFHFIKGTDQEPQATLCKILDEKKLVSNRGYICFSASPITAIVKFFEIKTLSTGNPLYHPYGLGFSRDTLVSNYKARNVIYYDSSDKEDIPEELMWRAELLSVDGYDFEYLREWRIHGGEFDFSSFPVEDLIIIAPSQTNLNTIVVKEDMEFTPIVDYINEDIEPDWTDTYTRQWKGIAVDKLGKDYLDDYALSASMLNQVIGENVEEELFRESPLYLGGKKKKI